MSQILSGINASAYTCTLTGDVGGAISPVANNINVLGGNNIGTVGTAGTITINLNGTTDHAVQLGNAGGSLTSLGVGLTGTILQGNTAADPTWSTATYPSTAAQGDIIIASAANTYTNLTAGAATYVLTSNGAGVAPSWQSAVGNNTTYHTDSTDAVEAADAITIAGGNNIVTSGAGSTVTIDLNGMTDHALHVGNAASSLTSLGVATDGQLPIGSTGNDPVIATLGSTLGTIQYTAGAGTLALDSETTQALSGFSSWDGAGPYFDDTVIGDFEVSQSGVGYIKGKKVTWAAPQTETGMTAGNTYYIYIDDTGTIGKTTVYNSALFSDNIVLFECMRDSTAGTNIQVTVKENHPYQVPWETSVFLHDVIGCVIANNRRGANIVLNGTQKIEISGDDELEDHGLVTDIPDSSGVAVVFRQYFTLGSGKWAQNSSTDTFVGEYNNAGTVTALGANKYGVYTLYASKDNLNASTPIYIAILNTAQYNNLSSAQTAIADGSIATVSGELAALEVARLGYIVFAESSTSIVEVIIDKETLRSSSSTSGTNVASLVLTDIANFDGILSASDTTVQAALETIDDWGKDTDDHALLVANGVGAPLTSLAVGATGEGLMGSTGADPTWTSSPSFGGTVTAQDDFKSTAGSFFLPMTDAAGAGRLYIDNKIIFQTYGNATDYNIFLGYQAGNVSLTGGTAKFNVGVGYRSLLGLTTGNRNLSFGPLNLTSLQTGAYNVCIGYGGGSTYTTSESSNVLIANNGTILDNNTIRIGRQGSGSNQHNKCFVAGIYNTAPAGGSDNVVVIDSNGQLGAQATLDVANGGTGAATLTDHGVLLGSGTGAVSVTAVGTADQVLTSNGAGSDPTWQDAASPLISINAQTGTAYTLVLTDVNKMITCSNAAAITLTVPPHSSVAFDDGTQIIVAQKGAGTVTFAEGSGVTINSADGLLDTYAQYSVVSLIQTEEDVWYLSGDLG